jgi:hypothetical protein
MNGLDGVMLLVDEFGRFIDGANNALAAQNLADCQDIAELCDRLPNGRLVLVVMLHQNFEDYAKNFGRRARMEWGKIAGRFQQVSLLEEPDNLYDMIASALHLSEDGRETASQRMEGAWAQVKDLEPFQKRANAWKERLPSLFPLHPLVVYCLPRLASELGQNERTLASFLLADEPHGLRDYLRRSTLASESLLCLDWLCDYFLLNQANSLQHPLLRRELARLNLALELTYPGLETRIIKAIGALGFARTSDLRPTEGVLAAALGVESGSDWAILRSTLEAMVSRKVLMQRRNAGEYRLSPSSEFDFVEAMAEETTRLREVAVDLANVANNQLPQPHVIARRHAFETGSTRLAAKRFVNPKELSAVTLDRPSWQTLNRRAELRIDLVLCDSQDEITRASRWARATREGNRILVIPNQGLDVAELFTESRATQALLTRPELERDEVACEEAQLHLSMLRREVALRLRPLTSPGPQATWFWKGKDFSPSTDRDVQALVSRVCDSQYFKAPKITNELINRPRPAAIPPA